MRNYKDIHYIKWRQEIKKRDKFICQWPHCNSKHKLNAHHIIRWADNILLRYDLNNGITLCKYHHDHIKNKEDYFIDFFTKLLFYRRNPHES